jgi:hypothetical protein
MSVQRIRRLPALGTLDLNRAAAVLLLLFLFGQLLFSARLSSPTIDEPNHLTRGYAYLKTGDLRLSRVAGHPPLFNLLCALPLALVHDLELPLDHASWQSGFRNAFVTEFIFGGSVPIDLVFFLGRLPVILTTLCLAALIARWANELYGAWGRMVALVLCVLDPNLLAHGQLVTTDAGLTFFFFLTAYLFWRFLRNPSVVRLLLTGVALGAAQGVKFSAILLLPLLGLLGLIAVVRASAYPAGKPAIGWNLRWVWAAFDAGSQFERPGRLRRLLSGVLALGVVMAALVLLAGLVLWTIYDFQFGRPSGWQVAVPAPDYVDGLLGTLIHTSETGHPAFLMGSRSVQGWWYYFPIAFALKTPLPTLIVLLCAGVSNAWKRPSAAEWALGLIPAVYGGLSMLSALNIGYRHLLPILPFLWVYAARLGPLLQRLFKKRKRRWAVAVPGALGLWLSVGTLRVAPDYLAFFNELAGGPDGGWRYLVDSNLDWGQELPALKAYLDRQGTSRVYLSWFGSTYPHLYGLDLDYRLLPSHFAYPYPADAAFSAYNPVYPPPGVYAICATNLQGVGLAAGDVFAGFRDVEPVARIGHSIFIYDVEDPAGASQPASLAPTCISGLRFKDLTDETTAVSLGRAPGPVKWFGHATSFVLPATGGPAYVLPSLPLDFAPDWQASFLSKARVIHRQDEVTDAASGRHYPAATVYALDRDAADEWLADVLAALYTGPVGWSSATTFGDGTAVHALSSPVSFDHGLQLIGYLPVSGKTLKPGQAFELITVWRPTAEMPAAVADLKAFVHLLDEQGQVRAGQDLLDLYPPTWEPGDVLIQYHRLTLPGDVAPGTYQLELGLYTSIQMKRLVIYDGGHPVADRLLLQSIELVSR